MTLIPSSRIADALRRYGHPASLRRPGNPQIRLLVSDLSPLRHSDLPADGISAEALAMLPDAESRPREGEVIIAGDARWIVRSAMPIGDPHRRPDANGSGFYQLQLANHQGDLP
ncbi:MAG: hypothetical protein ACON31_05750 [Candidatus Puniceispirillaceae bacterium]